MDNSRLTEIFDEAGRKLGFEKINAQFREYRDFTIKWRRQGKTMDFYVTDYLSDAPRMIMEEVAEKVLADLTGKEMDYPRNVSKWLGDKMFIDRHRETYLSRWEGISEDSRGNYRDIETAFERVVGRGLADPDWRMSFRWIDTDEESLGTTSNLMRTMLVNRRLDSPEFSDQAFEFALFILAAKMQKNQDAAEALRKNYYRVFNQLFQEKAWHLMALSEAGFKL